MLRNISQNMYGAIVVRSDCAIAGGNGRRAGRSAD
jgi:hypothetical protein